jgi:hypothetical protein
VGERESGWIQAQNSQQLKNRKMLWLLPGSFQKTYRTSTLQDTEHNRTTPLIVGMDQTRKVCNNLGNFIPFDHEIFEMPLIFRRINTTLE